MKRVPFFVLLVLGCAPMGTTRGREVAVYCSGRDDCETKWALATRWLQNHSAYKFRNVTETLITTEGPLQSDPRAAFEITKFPKGGGAYEIQMRAGCANIFGCQPSISELEDNFMAEVGGQKTFRSVAPNPPPSESSSAPRPRQRASVPLVAPSDEPDSAPKKP